MKKLLTAFIGISLIASPAMARDRKHDNNRTEQHQHKKKNGASIVGALLLGGIIGAAIANADDYDDYNRRDDTRGYGDPQRNPYAYDRYSFPSRPRYYEHYCVTEQHVDFTGRIYFTRTCQ